MMNVDSWLHIQGGPKNWHHFVHLNLPNINRFSKLFRCQNRNKICNNTITNDRKHLKSVATLPCEMSSVLKATIENKTMSDAKRPTFIVTEGFIDKQNFRKALTKCQWQ